MAQLWEDRQLGAGDALGHGPGDARAGADVVLAGEYQGRRRYAVQLVAQIALGLTDKLRMGNMAAKRDWGYAPDFVRAMWLMLQQEEPEDFIIATGQTHSVKDLVEIAFCTAGLDPQKHVEIDPDLIRPAEVDFLVGDAAKAREKLGWEPTISFREMIEKMLEADMAYWSAQAASNAVARQVA